MHITLPKQPLVEFISRLLLICMKIYLFSRAVPQGKREEQIGQLMEIYLYKKARYFSIIFLTTSFFLALTMSHSIVKFPWEFLN